MSTKQIEQIRNLAHDAHRLATSEVLDDDVAAAIQALAKAVDKLTDEFEAIEGLVP